MIENLKELSLEVPMQYQPRYMEWYMDHVCTHVPHLDLVDIGQNMSTTDRLMGTLNIMKKNFKLLDATAAKPKNPRKCAPFAPPKNFFILTLHTHRQSLD